MLRVSECGFRCADIPPCDHFQLGVNLFILFYFKFQFYHTIPHQRLRCRGHSKFHARSFRATRGVLTPMSFGLLRGFLFFFRVVNRERGFVRDREHMYYISELTLIQLKIIGRHDTMCGIFALFGSTVEVSSKLLTHRGPNDYRTVTLGNVRWIFTV